MKITNSLGNLNSYNNNAFTGISLRENPIDSGLNCTIYNELTINWNMMICQYMQIKKQITVFTINNKLNINLKPESIISKFGSPATTGGNNHQPNNSNNKEIKEDYLFSRMNNFFTHQLNFINQDHILENSQLLVLIFNKIVFFYKTSNYSGCIKTSCDLLSYMKICNPPLEESFSFILFINTSLILIEILIAHNLPFLASIILERVEVNLAIKFNDKLNETLDEEIQKYLSSIEYLHNGSKTWDEIYCVINIFKSLRDICSSYNQVKTDESAKFLKTYEELESKCRYKNQIPVFSTIKSFYECVQIKMMVMEDYNNIKINKMLCDIWNKIINYGNNYLHVAGQCGCQHEQKTKDGKNTGNYGSTLSMNTNLSYLSTVKELYIFYLNTQAILFIKKRKFNLAEFHIKTAIAYYEKICFLDNSKKDFSFGLKLGHIHVLKYNLALIYFYQKKYLKAKTLFTILSKSNNTQIIMNINLCYRLGLCCLELFNNNISENEENNNQNQQEYKFNNENEEEKCNNTIEKDKSENNNNITDKNEFMEKVFKSKYSNINKNCNYNFLKSREEIVLENLKKYDNQILSSSNKRKMSGGNSTNKKSTTTRSASNNLNTIGNNINTANLNQNLNNFNNYESFNHSHQIVLTTKKQISERENKLLIEAILAFKQILVLINQEIKDNQFLCGKSLYDIFTIFSSKQYYIDNMELIPYVNSNFKSKNHAMIIISTYLNLLYALVLLERWNEIIFYMDDFENTEYFNYFSKSFNHEIGLKLLSYKLIALIYLQRYSDAKGLSESLLLDKNKSGKYIFNSSNDQKNHKELKDYKLLFRFSNFFTDDNTSYNMAMLVNFAKMHYSKGNIEEGDKVLNIIIQNLFKEKVKENQFPLYVVNLIIFTLLHKGLNDLVIKIVKYKKIYEVLNELKLIKNNK